MNFSVPIKFTGMGTIFVEASSWEAAGEAAAKKLQTMVGDDLTKVHDVSTMDLMVDEDILSILKEEYEDAMADMQEQMVRNIIGEY